MDSYCCYVDDCLIFCKDKKKVDKLISELHWHSIYLMDQTFQHILALTSRNNTLAINPLLNSSSYILSKELSAYWVRPHEIPAEPSTLYYTRMKNVRQGTELVLLKHHQNTELPLQNEARDPIYGSSILPILQWSEDVTWENNQEDLSLSQMYDKWRFNLVLQYKLVKHKRCANALNI